MSTDNIFAAQMWPWPDPVIKRNRAGQVLFINAAFLSLYGGRVETWTGQPVMGWPAPNQQGMPYRFETRAGTAPEETIYDWVEVVMADGNALAIARDVTVYQPPVQTQPVPEAEIAPLTLPAGEFDSAPAAPLAAFAKNMDEHQTPAQPAFETPPSPAPAQAAATQPHSQAFDLQGAPKTHSEPEASITEPALIVQPAHVDPAPVLAAPEIQAQEVHIPLAAQEVAAEVQTISVESQAPAAPQYTAPAAAQTPVRDFERRALPIENDEAVLGSNWRDAVIARAVGGVIAAEPEPAKSQEMPAPAPLNPADTKEPIRILLAEDNAINALLTRTLLEADGCIVETVEDGALAVDAAKNNVYDLILMDMRMPNMDGLEATRKIRAMGGERSDKWPIIALTANAFDDDRNACFDSGMNDFMTKPVSAEELTAMVTQWIDRSRAPKKETAIAV